MLRRGWGVMGDEEMTYRYITAFVGVLHMTAFTRHGGTHRKRILSGYV